jgi:Family of unknown function (DUF5677)
MALSEQVRNAIKFSDGLLGIAIETVGAANVSLSGFGARDPKIVSLALLCRTISNFKGAIVMVREGLVVEARTLTRSCYENLIWAAALNERRSEFVADMLNDDAASRKGIGQVTLKLSSRGGANNNDENAQILRDLIRRSESRFPDSKKLHVDKTALGSAVELAYATFGQLSLEAAHPTITAIGRHLHSELEGDTRHLVIDVVPDVSERQLLQTVWWSCDALLGVAIASDEIVGGTKMNDALRRTFEELRRLSRRDLEDQAAPAT